MKKITYTFITYMIYAVVAVLIIGLIVFVVKSSYSIGYEKAKEEANISYNSLENEYNDLLDSYIKLNDNHFTVETNENKDELTICFTDDEGVIHVCIMPNTKSGNKAIVEFLYENAKIKGWFKYESPFLFFSQIIHII